MCNHKASLTTLLALAAMIACNRGDREAAQSAALDSAAPAASTAPMANAASVRVVNAMPGASNLDVYMDSTPEITGVGFQAVSPYHEVTQGVQDVAITPAGAPVTAAFAVQSRLDLHGGTFTLVAARQAGSDSARIMVLRDDGAPTDPARARLRLVDAAPNGDAFDLYVEGENTPLLTGVRFGENEYQADVAPARVTLILRPAGARTGERLRIQDVALLAGQATTIVVTNPTKSSRRLVAITIPSQPTGSGS